MGSSDGWFHAPLLMLASLYFYYKAIRKFQLQQLIENTPTSTCASVAPGLVEVQGMAVKYRDEYDSPFQRKPCLYYKTDLFRWQGSGKQRSRVHVSTFESKEPFYLRDDSGHVLVQPTLSPKGGQTGIEMAKDQSQGGRVSNANLFTLILGETPKPEQNKIRSFVVKYQPDLSNYGDRIDVEETYVCAGDPLYVLGSAAWLDPEANKPQMIIRDDPQKGIFLMADGSQKEALSKTGRVAALGLLLTPLGVFFSIAWMGFDFGMQIALAMYGIVAAIWVVSLYNGLMLLKNQVELARANLDAVFQKRKDLIPELARTVKAYGSHEQEIQTELAALRNSALGTSNKSLLGAVERYPELKADKNFLLLQKQLSSLEEEIAGSRSFYNDAVMLYNNARQVFPRNLVAGLLGLPKASYLEP